MAVSDEYERHLRRTRTGPTPRRFIKKPILIDAAPGVTARRFKNLETGHEFLRNGVIACVSTAWKDTTPNNSNAARGIIARTANRLIGMGFCFGKVV